MADIGLGFYRDITQQYDSLPYPDLGLASGCIAQVDESSKMAGNI